MSDRPGPPRGSAWSERRPAHLALMTLLAVIPPLAHGPAASAAPLLRPGRLPGSPRFFGRVVRPVQPRSSLTQLVGHVSGSDIDGVRLDQWIVSLEGEIAVGDFGLFCEIPLVVDTARTSGVYGDGAGATRGIGDIRFGADMSIRSWEWMNRRWTAGAGIQVTAPTGGARQVRLSTPLLEAPAHVFGPAKWTLSPGGALAIEVLRDLHAQLDVGLTAHIRDTFDRQNVNTHWVFAAIAVGGAYQIWPWLVVMTQVELQLELLGQAELRQLVFVDPGLRLVLSPRLSIDLGLRIPIRQETVREHRLSFGFSLGIGVGPTGDGPW